MITSPILQRSSLPIISSAAAHWLIIQDPFVVCDTAVFSSIACGYFAMQNPQEPRHNDQA